MVNTVKRHKIGKYEGWMKRDKMAEKREVYYEKEGKNTLMEKKI